MWTLALPDRARLVSSVALMIIRDHGCPARCFALVRQHGRMCTSVATTHVAASVDCSSHLRLLSSCLPIIIH